jgi:hypothetical protein
MTLVGTHFLDTVHVVTQSVGTGTTDGWVKVAEMPAADWAPPAGAASTNAIVNVFWCSLGDLWNSAGSSNINNALQVTVGDDLGAYPAFAQTVRIDPRLEDRSGVPAFFVFPHVIGALGLWPANRRPAMWARIYTGGGPASGAPLQFAVTNVGMLSFYAANLNVHHFADREDWFGTRLRPATSGTVIKTFSPGASAITGTGKYLGFVSVRLASYSAARQPRMRLMLNDASAGTARPLLGKRWSGGVVPFDLKWGHSHLGSAITYASPSPHTISSGAWFTVEDLGVGDTFDVELHFNGGTAASALFEVADVSLFLVHEDNLGSFHSSLLDLSTGYDVHNDHDVSTISFEPLEYAHLNQQDFVAIACARYAPQAAAAGRVPMSHQMRIRLNGRTARGTDVYALTATIGDGVFEHAGDVLRVPVEGGRVEAFGIQNPRQLGGGLYRDTDDFCMATWGWENDPNFTPDLVPAVPAATFLTPGRESLGTGSLLALPFEPEQEFQHDADLPRRDWTADDETLVTWPRYLRVRARYRFAWSALSLADRDTLLDFLVANRTFRWTPPGSSTAIALTAVGDVQADDAGARRSSVSVELVQLVWIGP